MKDETGQLGFERLETLLREAADFEPDCRESDFVGAWLRGSRRARYYATMPALAIATAVILALIVRARPVAPSQAPNYTSTIQPNNRIAQLSHDRERVRERVRPSDLTTQRSAQHLARHS